MLAVGREDEVLRAQRAAGADLGGLLAEQLGPDAELAVALEGGGLGVDPPGEHHVAVEAAQLLGGEVAVELGVVDALTLGGQQLDELGAAVLLGGPEDLREVGAETGRVGQRNLLRSVRWSRDRRTPMAQCGLGVCDPDHMVASTYRQERASTNPTGGRSRTPRADADGLVGDSSTPALLHGGWRRPVARCATEG